MKARGYLFVKKTFILRKNFIRLFELPLNKPYALARFGRRHAGDCYGSVY